jgi:hypothetical protein
MNIPLSSSAAPFSHARCAEEGTECGRVPYPELEARSSRKIFILARLFHTLTRPEKAWKSSGAPWPPGAGPGGLVGKTAIASK